MDAQSGSDVPNGVELRVAPAIGVAQVGQGRRLKAAPDWVGATARVELTVTDADTAQAVGSGDVPVLATPRVLALVEAASVAATTTRLPPGTTTVGTRVDLEHRAATAVGRTVVAEARLAKTEGRRLGFEVVVLDAGQVVAEGRLERVLVDRHTFVERAFGSP